MTKINDVPGLRKYTLPAGLQRPYLLELNSGSALMWQAFREYWIRKDGRVFVDAQCGRDNDSVLIRDEGHLIELGQIENLDKKFRNLLAFYDKGFEKGGWDKYRRVSVKFENQIVCTRK